MKQAAARTLQQAWYRGAPWLLLLRPLEFLFRGAIALRRALYAYGLLASYRSSLPVVVVGNITLGGTGKTPVVIALATALQERGLRVGIVSRGYGATGLAFPLLVDSSSTAEHCGDEALLIARRTGCACAVDPVRANAVKLLETLGGIDIIVSDDGLQHYALARDLEILMCDAKVAFGNGRCLPEGPLREPLRRLDSVDFVLTRGGTDSQAAVQLQPEALVNVRTGEVRSLTDHKLSSSVYAVAGVALPQSFFQSLRQLGFSADEHSFPDHHPFTEKDLYRLDDKPIIMTEKDAVKCRHLAGDNSWYLQVRAVLPEAVVLAAFALVDG